MATKVLKSERFRICWLKFVTLYKTNFSKEYIFCINYNFTEEEIPEEDFFISKEKIYKVENGKLLEVSETTDNSLRLAMENIVFN